LYICLKITHNAERLQVLSLTVDVRLWCRKIVPPMLWSASQEGNDVLKTQLTPLASSPIPTTPSRHTLLTPHPISIPTGRL